MKSHPVRRLVGQSVLALLLAAGTGGGSLAQAGQGAGAAAAAPAPSPAIDKAQLRDALVALFKEDPQILLDGLRQAQAKEAADRQMAAAKALTSTARFVEADANIPSIGPANGRPVVEFFDYNCHFCKDFAAKTFEPVSARHHDLRWVYVFAPILGPGSQRLALFAAAAQLQGKFEPVHRYLIGRKDGAATAEQADALRDELVKAAGLDKARFDKALEDGSAKALVDHHWAYVTQAGITGTPTFVAGTGYIPGFATEEQFEGLLAASAKADKPASGGN